jgi:putative ABC transport system permease protein
MIMQQWLQTFAYRVDIGFGIFLLSGSAALFIALLTVSYHTIKAATANPVESLRHE